MIDKINDFAARHFGGVGTTGASFIRIAVWAVLFLIGLSLILPSQAPEAEALPANVRLHDPDVQDLTLDVNDVRAFADSPFPKDRFRIAWITGSEGAVPLADDAGVISYGYLPQEVRKALPEIDGRKVAVDLYYVPAMRLADSYIALLDAIESEPDMIVLSLNAAYVLNPLAVHQFDQLDARGARLLARKPGSWPLAAALFSPSDALWGAADSLEPFRDRSYYSAKIHDVVDDWGPIHRASDQEVARGKPDRYQRVLASFPVTFWYTERLNSPFPHDSKQWAHWLAGSNRGKSTLNEQVLKAMAKAIRESNIPTYVYLAQMNSGWLATDPQFDDSVKGIERQLKGFGDDFAADNIRYQPTNASRFVRGLHFVDQDTDLLHLRNGTRMAGYLTDELCRLVAQAKYSSTCDSRKDGTEHD